MYDGTATTGYCRYFNSLLEKQHKNAALKRNIEILGMQHKVPGNPLSLADGCPVKTVAFGFTTKGRWQLKAYFLKAFSISVFEQSIPRSPT